MQYRFTVISAISIKCHNPTAIQVLYLLLRSVAEPGVIALTLLL